MKPGWEIEHGIISLNGDSCKLQLRILTTEPTIKIPVAMSKVQKIECTATHTIQEGRLHIDCTGLSDCSLTITQKVGNADFVQGKDFGINLDHLLKCSWDFLISAPKHYTVVAPGELKRFSRPNDDLFHYKQSIPISLSSVQIIRGALECIRLFNQKPSKDDGEDQIADQSKIDVFFMPKDRKFIQSSCFYLPQALDFIEQWVGASYPFQSLKIVFLDNIVEQVSTGATIITANVNLLVPENVVDQVYNSRYYLSFAIASQWFGHYLTGASWDDSWLILGLCRVLAYMFMRKLYGNNEYKFRLTKDTERICLIDVRMPPLCSINVDAKKDLLIGKGKAYNEQFEVFTDPCSLRAELLHLKSGLVLLMMEKRFGKQLLAKLVSKFLMSQMSGELTMGLSTIEFLKTSRKISGHLEIKEFADQWIYGSGCPIFTTSYNFNRKKMVIELKIGQRSSNEGMSGATSKFTGPFTVRVQEPGGTFDTEIRIEEYQKQYDIIYHTKYKRIRRGAVRKGKKQQDEEEDEEVIEEGDEDFSTDVIAEPDRITFEWIRLDPEKHWLCHLTFEQDAFMWNTLVKQVKDVDAQYEAIVALGKMHTIPTGIKLSEFLVDENLFYRLRMEAALALTKFDTEEVEFLGLNNLCKYLEDKYMIPEGESGELIPKRNNYDEIHDYYIKHTILYALSHYRDSKGWSPTRIRKIIIQFLSLNDNGASVYSDSNTLAVLIDCLGMSFLPRPKNSDDLAWCLSERIKFKESRTFRSEDVEEFDFPVIEEAFSHRNSEIAKNFFQNEDDDLLEQSLQELARYLVKDRFNSSYKNAVTVACLEVLLKWQIGGLVPINVPLFLQYSRFGHNNMVRKMAIECLIVVTALKDSAVNRYLALMSLHDKDPYICYITAKNLTYFIGLAAQQLETASHATSRKETLKAEIDAMIAIWKPVLEANKAPEAATKYLKKILQLAKELFPAKTKIKFRMPSLANLKPDDAKVPEITGKDTPKQHKKKLPKVSKAVVKIEETIVLPDYLIKCLAMVKKLSSSKQGAWFRAPVDPVAMNLPNYFEVIKKPMDFGTVRRKTEQGEYDTEQEFVDDIQLVLYNAMSFNVPTNQVHIDAKTLKEKFEKEFLGIEPPKPVEDAEKDPNKVVETLLQKLYQSIHSTIFREPVNPELYPDYYEQIKNPMHLRRISDYISSTGYKSLQEFDQDMQLLFSNCYLYNKVGTFGYVAGIEFQTYYNKITKPFRNYITFTPVVKHSPVKKTAVSLAKKSIASPTPKKLSLKFSTPSLASGNEKQVPAISSMPKLTLKLARPVMDTPTKVLEPKMQKIKLKFGASLASKAEDGEQSKTPAKGEIAGPQIKAPTKAPGEAPKEEAAVVTPLKLKFKLKPKPE